MQPFNLSCSPKICTSSGKRSSSVCWRSLKSEHKSHAAAALHCQEKPLDLLVRYSILNTRDLSSLLYWNQSDTFQLANDHTIRANHCFHPCTSYSYFTVSRQALGAHILQSCSNDDLHQWIRSDSSIEEVCI